MLLLSGVEVGVLKWILRELDDRQEAKMEERVQEQWSKRAGGKYMKMVHNSILHLAFPGAQSLTIGIFLVDVSFLLTVYRATPTTKATNAFTRKEPRTFRRVHIEVVNLVEWRRVPRGSNRSKYCRHDHKVGPRVARVGSSGHTDRLVIKLDYVNSSQVVGPDSGLQRPIEVRQEYCPVIDNVYACLIVRKEFASSLTALQQLGVAAVLVHFQETFFRANSRVVYGRFPRWLRRRCHACLPSRVVGRRSSTR